MGNAQREAKEGYIVSVETDASDYYSSLLDEDVAEHANWGEFVLRQFSNEEKA